MTRLDTQGIPAMCAGEVLTVMTPHATRLTRASCHRQEVDVHVKKLEPGFQRVEISDGGVLRERCLVKDVKPSIREIAS
jgi:hypothetical protein